MAAWRSCAPPWAPRSAWIPAQIICGNGSDELLVLLIQAYGGPGTELIMSEHGFLMYEIAGKVTGCTVLKAPETDLTIDVDALLALVTPATRMVFVTNPSNPTGTMLTQSEMQRLRDGLPDDVLLVIDAAYCEYVEREDFDPGVKLVDAGENTVMTRTFSKIFGLGGARLGWAYAPPAIIDVLNRVRPPFNVSTITAAAAMAVLADPAWLEQSRAHNTQAKRRLAARLTQAGLKVYPVGGEFPARGFRQHRTRRRRRPVIAGPRHHRAPREILRLAVLPAHHHRHR